MAQGSFDVIADRQLDDGVLAVVGFDDDQRISAVGDEGVVLPLVKEHTLRVGSERADATDAEAEDRRSNPPRRTAR